MSDKGKYHDGNYYYEGAEKSVNNIINKIVAIKQNYEYIIKRSDEVERAYQDILHYIEFADLSANEGYKAYKKLQQIRIERRLLKGELEEVKIANEAVNNPFVNSFLDSLKVVHSQCKKSEINFEKHYNLRNPELSGLDKNDFKEIETKYNDKLKQIIIRK